MTASLKPVPLGRVTFDHILEPLGEGKIRVVKRVDVYGGTAPLIRLFAPRMKRDITESMAALERMLTS